MDHEFKYGWSTCDHDWEEGPFSSAMGVAGKRCCKCKLLQWVGPILGLEGDYRVEGFDSVFNNKHNIE